MEQTNIMNKSSLMRHMNAVGIALLVCAALMFSSDIAYGWFVQSYSKVLDVYTVDSIVMAFDMATTAIAYLVPFYILSLLLKVRSVSMLNFRSCSLKTVIAYSSMLIALYLLFEFISNSLVLQVTGNELLYTLDVLFQHSNVMIQVVYSIYFILLAPFFEEFAFRGVILNITNRVGGIFGMFATSILYSLFVMGDVNFIVFFVMSLFLSLIAMMYQSIIPGYLMRVILNSFIVFSIYVPAEYGWLVGLLVVVIYVVALVHLYKTKSKHIIFNESLPLTEAWIAFFKSWILIVVTIILVFRGIYFITF